MSNPGTVVSCDVVCVLYIHVAYIIIIAYSSVRLYVVYSSGYTHNGMSHANRIMVVALTLALENVFLMI